MIKVDRTRCDFSVKFQEVDDEPVMACYTLHDMADPDEATYCDQKTNLFTEVREWLQDSTCRKDINRVYSRNNQDDTF